MTFWAMLEEAERQRLDQWLDVEPAECELCHEVKRGVLLGSCVECFETWRSHHGRPAL